MKKLMLITLFLHGSCIHKTDKYCKYNLPKIPNSYIHIETKTNKQICVSFEDLILITPFDVLDFEVGKKERAAIACGNRLIDSLEIKTLLNKPNSPIFVFESKSKLDNVDSLLNFSLLKNGVFDIQQYDFQTRGLLIKAALNRNNAIFFSDNNGNYLWKK